MKNYFILFLLAIFTPAVLNAQSIEYLESQLGYLNRSLNFETMKLDSLQKVLENKADQITKEKAKGNKSNGRIIDLMSGSATLSNKIENQQYKIQEIEKNLESVKKRLYNKYSNIIDSLKKSQTQVKSGKDIQILNDKILDFTEKKLLVSPKINSLTFDPQKLIEIDLKTINNPEEKNVYTSYLRNALSEINQQILNVENSYNEIQQIVYLQKKAGRFMEETEFDNEITPLHRRHISSNDLPASNGYFPDGNIRDVQEAVKSQVTSYNILLNQLSFNQSSKWNTKGTTRKDFSLKSYQSMLKELKNRLQDYKSVLLNKLDTK